MTCKRINEEVQVHYNEIQVGDLIKLKAGMNIPVDGIVIQSSGLLTNEAAMTGESEEQKKESLFHCLLRRDEKQ